MKREMKKTNIPSAKAHDNDSGGVRAVERAADILICLGKGEGTLSEISKEVGLNKATVLRMLVSLERKGFVSKDPLSARYALDWRFMGMFSSMLTRDQGLANISYPFMEKLWKLTNETITLYVRKGYDRLCIAELPSPQPLKYTAGIGVTVPLHAGSPGKLLLAFMPPEEMAEALEKIEMFRLTNKTITSREVLLKELMLIRKQGWSTSFGERIDGVSSLSVPVFNAEKRVNLSLNILGPFVRLGEEILMGYLEPLREAALNLSNRLGYYEDSHS